MVATSATRNPVNANDPHSIFNNWRVPDSIAPAPTEPPPPVNRNWLLELLQKHDNPTTPSDLKEKALVVAPMVDQSDLPFRLQCRKYGANLCFTPMIHSRLFLDNAYYRAKFMTDTLPAADRPLIAQLCGPDPAAVLQTAQAIAPYVDGIDLNCGCPQGIAKRGLYGAFLLEEPELLISIVQTLVHKLPNTPICVKVRLLPTGTTSVQDSLDLYKKLVDCGISMLTIHGRTRLNTNFKTGPADWSAIRQAVDLLGHKIPILANGGIASLHDVRQCLEATHADGVMSSEAILEYPPLFADETLHLHKRSFEGRLELAHNYMSLCEQYPPEKGGQGSGLKCIRMHLHKFLHADLQSNPKFRTICVKAVEMQELWDCLRDLKELRDPNHSVTEEPLSWYKRHEAAREKHLPSVLGVAASSDDPADYQAGFFGNDNDDDDGDY